jgi:hypothetical protein
MPPESILVINASAAILDDEVRRYVAAIQTFMPEFNAAWGYPEVDVAFAPHGQAIPDGFGHIQVIADSAEQVSYLGYHEVAPSGFPIGFTFVEVARMHGSEVSAVLTHELWEARSNPLIERVVLGPDGRQWFYENADAVQADKWGFRVNGVLLSNFVLPSYFDFTAPAGPAYDYQGLLRAPIPAMLPGGYLAFQEPGGAYGQIHAADMDRIARLAARPQPFGRRYRAMLRTWERPAE